MQKSIIQSCNTILKALMFMHQLVNLVQTTVLYITVRNKERNFVCSAFFSTQSLFQPYIGTFLLVLYCLCINTLYMYGTRHAIEFKADYFKFKHWEF